MILPVRFAWNWVSPQGACSSAKMSLDMHISSDPAKMNYWCRRERHGAGWGWNLRRTNSDATEFHSVQRYVFVINIALLFKSEEFYTTMKYIRTKDLLQVARYQYFSPTQSWSTNLEWSNMTMIMTQTLLKFILLYNLKVKQLITGTKWNEHEASQEVYEGGEGGGGGRLLQREATKERRKGI